MVELIMSVSLQSAAEIATSSSMRRYVDIWNLFYIYICICIYKQNLYFSLKCMLFRCCFLILFSLFISRLPIVLLLISRQLGESDFVFYSLSVFIDSIPLFARYF